MEGLGMIPFLLGLSLGLMMILPVGAQSLFVINQGLLAGFPRAWVGAIAVCCCDSLLIVLGAAGASALLAALGYREVLIICGSAFLVVMGLLTLKAHPPRHADGKHLTNVGVSVAQAVGVSVLNPHAFLDTVGVLGAAIAAQPVKERIAFAVGVVGASWVWYLILSLGASTLQGRLTLSRRFWIQRVSGVLMLIFAGVLAFELT